MPLTTPSISENLSSRHSEHLEAAFHEPGISPRVAVGTIAPVVTVTVYFNDKASFVAEKVGRVGTGRMLLTKLQSARPALQSAPEPPFGRRHLLTELS